MEPKYEEIVKVINKLIVINDERMEAYKWASNEIGELGLRSLFKQFASTSREFADELKNELMKLKVKIYDYGPSSLKVCKVWMEVRNSILTRDRKKVLSYCEMAEEIILQEYELTIDMQGISEDIKDIIHAQFAELVESHDTIRALKHALVAA